MTLAEFKRNFTPWEVFGVGFTLVGLVQSISYVSHCASPTTEKVYEYKYTKLYSRIFNTIWRPIGHGLGSTWKRSHYLLADKV